jgi:hypothetical protein
LMLFKREDFTERIKEVRKIIEKGKIEEWTCYIRKLIERGIEEMIDIVSKII